MIIWCEMDNKAYIENMIRKYDKILLISGGVHGELKWNDFFQVNLINRNILILSTELLNIKEKLVIFEQIDEGRARDLYTLYHTYEFADNFILLEGNSTFATIFNYVQTGILTPEEAWQALLGE